MGSRSKFLALLSLALFVLRRSCYGATISGTVKGPDGAPVEGAFIQAQNTKTKISVFCAVGSCRALSRREIAGGRLSRADQGHRFARRCEERHDSGRGPERSAGFCDSDGHGALERAFHLPGEEILAGGKGQANDFHEVFHLPWISNAHGFGAARCGRLERPRAVHARLDAFQPVLPDYGPGCGGSIVRISTSCMASDSEFPKSPAEMPGYKDTVRPFYSDAMNIAYVEYDMPGPSRMPFSAAPAKDGCVWIPNFGIGNKITRLNPNTAEMQDFPVPNVGTAAVHSAVRRAGRFRVAHRAGLRQTRPLGPEDAKITEYQDAYAPGLEGREDGGSRHTVRIDSKGMVWSSGYPLTRFDPETGKFNDFPEAAHTYSLTFDKDENVWFTNPGSGEIGKVDSKTLKVTQWLPPTHDSYERRLAIDSDGIVWFGEFQKGKIGRFDPKTQAFKEYDVPGGIDSFPYAIGIGADHSVWYSSYYLDVIGRLDPKTGKILEYPFPHSENTIREFFPDSAGRIWYGSPSNNKVGYFYLTGATTMAGK